MCGGMDWGEELLIHNDEGLGRQLCKILEEAVLPSGSACSLPHPEKKTKKTGDMLRYPRRKFCHGGFRNRTMSFNRGPASHATYAPFNMHVWGDNVNTRRPTGIERTSEK